MFNTFALDIFPDCIARPGIEFLYRIQDAFVEILENQVLDFVSQELEVQSFNICFLTTIITEFSFENVIAVFTGSWHNSFKLLFAIECTKAK